MGHSSENIIIRDHGATSAPVPAGLFGSVNDTAAKNLDAVVATLFVAALRSNAAAHVCVKLMVRGGNEARSEIPRSLQIECSSLIIDGGFKLRLAACARPAAGRPTESIPTATQSQRACPRPRAETTIDGRAAAFGRAVAAAGRAHGELAGRRRRRFARAARRTDAHAAWKNTHANPAMPTVYTKNTIM